ncbi:MAG TPA: hypothetical protein VFW34_05810 [Candidatus Rubrimentiphilum sp.]|nr:hypothetical protein [Candidatus Rubrimentiphilum sp.]
MIALLGSVVLAAAAASPPPTILRERVSPVCSTLHQLVIPLAQMNIKNRALTDKITLNYDLIRKYQDTRLGDGVFLRVAQNDMLATNLLTNIHDVEKQLLKSYAAYPQGTNVKVDALRQRVQNVVGIERMVANMYSSAYGAVVDNDGVTGIENSLNQMVGTPLDPHAPATPPPADIALPAPPDLPNEAGASAAIPWNVADSDPKLASMPPAGFAMRSFKYSRLSELQSLLHREGPALEAQALIAAHDCDGV